MFFDSCTGLGRVIAVCSLAYIALVLILRISGKRTHTKLNAFDFVVTVALGSTLATVLLSKSVAPAESILALTLVVFLQFVITSSSVRSSQFQASVKSDPTLIMHQGRFLDSAGAPDHTRRGHGGAAFERSRGCRWYGSCRAGDRRFHRRHQGSRS